MHIEGEFICNNLEINCPNLRHLAMKHCFMKGYLPSSLVYFSAHGVYSFNTNFMRYCNRIKHIYVHSSGGLMDKAGDIDVLSQIVSSIRVYSDTMSTAVVSECLQKTSIYNASATFIYTPYLSYM